MDRLTIRWEYGDEIYFALAKDPEGAYDIFSLARLAEEGDGEEASILLDISNRLAAYEDTGLMPEEIERLIKSDASKEQSSINYYSEAKQLRAEIAALKAENERLRVDKKAMVPSLERLKELNIATAFIALDRLKEICDYERAERDLRL